MSEKILVPLDGSPLGETALRYVEGMLERLGTGRKREIILLNVVTNVPHTVTYGYNVSAPAFYSEEEMEDMRAKSAAYLEGLAAGFKAKGVAVTVKVVDGENPADAIIKAEGDLGVDLVAMSTHGRSGLSRWAFGSVADKVLRGGHVPVLMVRAREK